MNNYKGNLKDISEYQKMTYGELKMQMEIEKAQLGYAKEDAKKTENLYSGIKKRYKNCSIALMAITALTIAVAVPLAFVYGGVVALFACSTAVTLLVSNVLSGAVFSHLSHNIDKEVAQNKADLENYENKLVEVNNVLIKKVIERNDGFAQSRNQVIAEQHGKPQELTTQENQK